MRMLGPRAGSFQEMNMHKEPLLVCLIFFIATCMVSSHVHHVSHIFPHGVSSKVSGIPLVGPRQVVAQVPLESSLVLSYDIRVTGETTLEPILVAMAISYRL